MTDTRTRPPLKITVWPEVYAVAQLSSLPEVMPPLAPDASPVAVIVGHHEISLLAPASVVEAVATHVLHVAPGWRAFTLDTVFAPGVVGVLARLSRALAETGIPLMAFSSHDTDHFLVPERQLGRALAALNQAGLERFLT